MKTVILGSTGFVGQHLIHRLHDLKREVKGFSSRELNLLEPHHLRQLADEGPDICLVVLSALTPDRGLSQRLLTDNVRMIVNLFDHLEARPVNQVVYFSSDALYAFDQTVITEESPLALTTGYSLAKRMAEQVLQMHKGSAVTILRPTAIFGPGDTHRSYGPNRFMHQAKTCGVVKVVGHGEETRDHLFVEDAVDLAIRLAGVPGTFNLATGDTRSFASVLEDLQQITSLAVEWVPRQQPVTHRTFDIGKLRKAVPRFRFTPFREALELTYAGD